jgi:putative effector of murein hydrolase LrgA (UPF0299 family)
VKSNKYSDRVRKEYAYDVLVTEVKTVDKDINRDTVVKKVNCLLKALDLFFLPTAVMVAT